MLILAGKGHEDYQVLRGGTICFDERRIVSDILTRLRGRKFSAVGASKFQQRAPGILHIEYAPILRGIIRPAFLRNRKSLRSN